MDATASAKKRLRYNETSLEQDLARKAWHKRKEPCPGQGSFYSWSVQSYLRLDESGGNLAFNVVPRLLTTVMIAQEMPAAIRPYSMAVNPDSSFANFATISATKSSNTLHE